ncbi:hypothetical protein F5Y10DRAFT_292493 [Nemania abortiva]|nr:hypothetical protein F5Y10DRAFT_292493 [Nemania abortiva]
MDGLRSCLPRWEIPGPTGVKARKIEDYNPGYPRFSALISAHGPYFLSRRFDKLRARLLLLKQDRLSMLEEELEGVDREEASPIFLGKSRCDRNEKRKSLLSKIESGLADYDQFAERTYRVLSRNPAEPRDVESLQNWLHNTGCLAREETAYLTHHEELVSLAPPGDNAMVRLEAWVEGKIMLLWPSFQKGNVSDDPNAVDLVTATATYATILIVFVSGSRVI